MTSGQSSNLKGLGNAVSILLSVFALPVVFIILLSDVPPNEPNPPLHLALRGAFMGWYLALIGFVSAFLIGDKTWRWALLVWSPAGALIILSVTRILLSRAVKDLLYLLLVFSVLLFSISGSFGSVALANRVRRSRLRWPYMGIILAIFGLVGFFIIRRIA